MTDKDKNELDDLRFDNLPVPASPDQKWDYDSAVKRTRKAHQNFKRDFEAFSRELYYAYVVFRVDKSGAAKIRHEKLAVSQTFSSFCEDVGITRQGALKLLKRIGLIQIANKPVISTNAAESDIVPEYIETLCKEMNSDCVSLLGGSPKGLRKKLNGENVLVLAHNMEKSISDIAVAAAFETERNGNVLAYKGNDVEGFTKKMKERGYKVWLSA